MSHPELTERQVREVNVALRHLGRAMKALERASLPDPVPFQGWLHSLRDGAVSVAHASDELIDGLETLAQWGSEPLPPWHEAHEPTDQSPSEPASQLERGINAPTGDHTDGAQRER